MIIISFDKLISRKHFRSSLILTIYISIHPFLNPYAFPVSCDSEFVADVFFGLAGVRRDPERRRFVVGQRSGHCHESSPGSSCRPVEREDGGDQRGCEAAWQSNHVGQPVAGSSASDDRWPNADGAMLRHGETDLHGPPHGPDRVLLPIRAYRRLSTARRATDGRAFHVQRAVRGCSRRRRLRGHGRLFSKPGGRAGALLYTYGELTSWILSR